MQNCHTSICHSFCHKSLSGCVLRNCLFFQTPRHTATQPQGRTSTEQVTEASTEWFTKVYRQSAHTHGSTRACIWDCLHLINPRFLTVHEGQQMWSQRIHTDGNFPRKSELTYDSHTQRKFIGFPLLYQTFRSYWDPYSVSNWRVQMWSIRRGYATSNLLDYESVQIHILFFPQVQHRTVSTGTIFPEMKSIEAPETSVQRGPFLSHSSWGWDRAALLFGPPSLQKSKS